MNMKTRYERLREELETTGTGTLTTGGGSMTPIFPAKTSVQMTFERQEDYEVGDIVFALVRGRFIDAHLVTAKDANRGYLISNNHGYQNGWTHRIFGRVVKAEWGTTVKTFK
jgi:SOS-response transcriptional repressor LexA